MLIQKLPRKIRNYVHFAIFAAAICLFAITSFAGNHGKKTINGQGTSNTIKSDEVMMNEATVAAADVIESNGVVHVINNVILPD